MCGSLTVSASLRVGLSPPLGYRRNPGSPTASVVTVILKRQEMTSVQAILTRDPVNPDLDSVLLLASQSSYRVDRCCTNAGPLICRASCVR
jgi:hypothetical protein